VSLDKSSPSSPEPTPSPEQSSARETFYVCHIMHPNDRVYAENLCDFFDSRHVRHKVIEYDHTGPKTELLGALRSDAIGILGFNHALDHAWIDTTNFLAAAAEMKVPVIQWILDHPSSRWPQFSNTTPENSRFSFLSAYSEGYFRRFIMPDCRSAWMMGTGTSRHSRIDALTRESFLARDIKCLLPLNLRRIGGTIEEAEQRLAALPEHLGRAARAAIERAQHDLDHPIERHFFDNAPPAEVLETPNLLHHCIQIIEEIVQIRRRLEVFAVACGFPVLIQSDVASSYLQNLKSAALEENVGMRETASRMRRAQAVVSLTHINDEVHNRTLNGLNAGAVNIIEDNVAHRHIFTHGKNALLFRYGDDSLRECLDLVCSRPDRAYEIAQAGLALRDDPRLRFAGYDSLLSLADAPAGPGRASA
jgi:hypothetical protein